MIRRRIALAAIAVLCSATVACTSTNSGGGGPLGRPSNGASTTDEPSGDGSPSDGSSTDQPDGDPDSGPVARLDWSACDDETVTDETLECATLSVPLDHDQPAGEHIDIAVIRVPASDQDGRVGAVLTNPGGPGASGFDLVALNGTYISDLLGLEQFDLVGFDPRGVDRSNGIRCLTDAQQDATVYLDDSPDTPDERAALDAATEQFQTACIQQYGDSLRHYSTDATARDMDAIRAAMGDDQISYLGFSYGTYLGATYATLFPDRVRAMVLDAPYEPTGDTVEQQYTMDVVGFEHAFDNWIAWCQTTDDCAFRSDDVGADWDALSLQLEATPVAADDGRLANQAVLNIATIASLYAETDWPALAAGLAAVRDGDPTGLFVLADDYLHREDDGTYATLFQANRIITCASGINNELPDDPAAMVDTLHRVAPRFSRDVTEDDFEDTCAPLMPDVTPRALQYEGDAAMLVVGGSNDPATPFRWAEETDAAMGDGARLVTYTGEGHASLLVSDCVAEIEARALVDLEVPDDGTVCDPDPEVARPEWWDALPVPDVVSDTFENGAVNGLLGLGPTVAYSELRTSAAGPTDVLDAYDQALDDAGFQVGGRAEPTPGVTQGVYLTSGGDLFSILVIGPDSFDEADLGALTDLLPADQTLVVLLALPD